MLWLVDIGNSRVKVAWWDGAVRWRASLPSDPRLGAAEYHALLAAALPVPPVLPAATAQGATAPALPTPPGPRAAAGGAAVVAADAAVVASVVPALVPAWTALLKERVGVGAVLTAQELFAADPTLAYEAIAHLGDDRVANIVALRAALGGGRPGAGATLGARPGAPGAPLFVVGLGTATTVDAWSFAAGYLGSTIACGLEVAAHALFAAAALLPPVALEPPPAAACRDEPGALRSGLLLGHAGLVSGLLDRFSAELGPPARVIATGGLAQMVAPHVPAIDEVWPDMTLIGLAQAYAAARGAARGASQDACPGASQGANPGTS